MGKAGTWRDTDWAKRERLEELAKPMGRFCKQYRLGYTITEWIPDYGRLGCFHKRLHGPLQRDDYWRKRDRTGKFVVLPNQKKHVIAKYLNSFGEKVKNYDTDHAQTLDNVLHEYNVDLDMWKMLQTVKEVRVTKRGVRRNLLNVYTWI